MCLALLTLLRATLSGGPTRGSLLGLRGWEVELRLGVPNLGCPATEAAGMDKHQPALATLAFCLLRRTASRTITDPPTGPGTVPFTMMRFRSASIDTTGIDRLVTATWPIWPAIRLPFLIFGPVPRLVA